MLISAIFFLAQLRRDKKMELNGNQRLQTSEQNVDEFVFSDVVVAVAAVVAVVVVAGVVVVVAVVVVAGVVIFEQILPH